MKTEKVAKALLKFSVAKQTRSTIYPVFFRRRKCLVLRATVQEGG